MNGNVLLDTNCVIAIFAEDADVLRTVSNATECFVPVIVLGELFYGARHSTQVESNVKRIAAFCDAVSVLLCDRDTAAEYGRLKSELRAKGRPIPENDVWIAALAMQHRLSILSNDDHFDDITGLTRSTW